MPSGLAEKLFDGERAAHEHFHHIHPDLSGHGRLFETRMERPCETPATAIDGGCVGGRAAIWAATTVTAFVFAWAVGAAETREALNDSRTAHPEAGELSALCPSPLEAISVACDEALQGHYRSRSVLASLHWYPGGEPQEWWSPLPINHAPVWDDLFGDPSSLRLRVATAIRRAECVVPEGTVRHDLRDTCDARSMTELGLLFEACLPLGRATGGHLRDWQHEWASEYATASTRLHRDGATAEAMARHLAWRLRRCREVPPSVFDFVRGLPKPSSFWRVHVGQAHHLRLLASRLGDVWASARSVGTEDDINSAAATDLAVGYVRRAGRSYIRSSSPEFQLYLPYLLVARHIDLRRDRPVFDWRRLSDAFTADEIEDATPAADRILNSGWEPLRKRGARTLPRERRRWIGEDGLERVQYADEPEAIVTGDGFLSRCGQAGREQGHLPLSVGAEVAAPSSVGRSEQTRRHVGQPEVRAGLRRWTGADGEDCVLAADGTVME